MNWSLSFCSSHFSWITTVLYHSRHCGWIPYLWEKLPETFGLNHTYLRVLFLWPTLFAASYWRPQRGSCRKCLPTVGRCNHPGGDRQSPMNSNGSTCSFHGRCLPLIGQLVDLTWLLERPQFPWVQNQTGVLTSTSLASAFCPASPSLSNSFIQQMFGLLTGPTCLISFCLMPVTVPYWFIDRSYEPWHFSTHLPHSQNLNRCLTIAAVVPSLVRPLPVPPLLRGFHQAFLQPQLFRRPSLYRGRIASTTPRHGRHGRQGLTTQPHPASWVICTFAVALRSATLTCPRDPQTASHCHTLSLCACWVLHQTCSSLLYVAKRCPKGSCICVPSGVTSS